MIKLLSMYYYFAPILAVGSVVVFFIWRDIDKRAADVKQLRAQFVKRDAADMLRIGAKMQRERWVYKLEKWKNGKGIKTALLAGAKRIDEMRAQ